MAWFSLAGAWFIHWIAISKVLTTKVENAIIFFKWCLGGAWCKPDFYGTLCFVLCIKRSWCIAHENHVKNKRYLPESGLSETPPIRNYFKDNYGILCFGISNLTWKIQIIYLKGLCDQDVLGQFCAEFIT